MVAHRRRRPRTAAAPNADPAGRQRGERELARARRHGRAFGVVGAVALGGLALAAGDLGLSCPTGAQPFAPTALAFGAGGELYVTDAEQGTVFRVDGARCTVLAEGWSRPYGVAVLGDGRVCVGHFTSADPLTREAAVSCWDGTAWALAARGLGSGVNGLATGPDGLWVAAWADTPVESRNGVLVLLDGNRVQREIRLEDGVPRFLTGRPDGGLLITVVREDASGITGGDVLERSPDGRLARLESGLARPAGIAWSPSGLWIVDERSGDLALLTPERRRLIHPRYARGASGLAVGAEGEVCLADPGRSSITCASRAALFGEEMQHEE